MANDLSNSFQTLRSFAERHRLKVRRDECGDLYIPGRFGQLYEYAPDRLAVLFLGATPRQWNAARKKLEAAGFEITHDADTEGIALFDPTDAEQCRVAIQVVKAKPRRLMSPAQQEQLEAATAQAVVSRKRQNCPGQRGFRSVFSIDGYREGLRARTTETGRHSAFGTKVMTKSLMDRSTTNKRRNLIMETKNRSAKLTEIRESVTCTQCDAVHPLKDSTPLVGGGQWCSDCMLADYHKEDAASSG